MPQWNPISVSGYHIREAGSTAVQELAFTLADGFAYVEAGLERGTGQWTSSRRGSRSSSTPTSISSRRSRSSEPRGDLGEADAEQVRRKESALTGRSGSTPRRPGCTLTAQQPENNIVRTAFQALAGVLGGTQSLHTNSMDETLALPSEKAVKIALRTQQIIAHETGVMNTIDPLGGSYFVEALDRQDGGEGRARILRRSTPWEA